MLHITVQYFTVFLHNASIASTSEVFTTVVLALLMTGNFKFERGMASSGMMFVKGFMQISRLIQSLLRVCILTDRHKPISLELR
jgi:hypothetical protein